MMRRRTVRETRLEAENTTLRTELRKANAALRAATGGVTRSDKHAAENEELRKALAEARRDVEHLQTVLRERGEAWDAERQRARAASSHTPTGELLRLRETNAALAARLDELQRQNDLLSHEAYDRALDDEERAS